MRGLRIEPQEVADLLLPIPVVKGSSCKGVSDERTWSWLLTLQRHWDVGWLPVRGGLRLNIQIPLLLSGLTGCLLTPSGKVNEESLPRPGRMQVSAASDDILTESCDFQDGSGTAGDGKRIMIILREAIPRNAAEVLAWLEIYRKAAAHLICMPAAARGNGCPVLSVRGSRRREGEERHKARSCAWPELDRYPLLTPIQQGIHVTVLYGPGRVLIYYICLALSGPRRSGTGKLERRSVR